MQLYKSASFIPISPNESKNISFAKFHLFIFLYLTSSYGNCINAVNCSTFNALLRLTGTGGISNLLKGDNGIFITPVSSSLYIFLALLCIALIIDKYKEGARLPVALSGLFFRAGFVCNHLQ